MNIIQSAATTDNNNKHPRPQLFLVHAILDKEPGKILEYRQLVKHHIYKEVWKKSYANELGRLTQGIRDIPGTNTMFFIHKHEISTDRQKDITFGKIVTDCRPQKSEPNQTRLAVVGIYMDYPWDMATPTSDLGTAKLLFNSAISTPGATFLGMDILKPPRIHEIETGPHTNQNHRKIQSPIKTDGSTYASTSECMAYLKPAFLPTNSWLSG